MGIMDDAMAAIKKKGSDALAAVDKLNPVSNLARAGAALDGANAKMDASAQLAKLQKDGPPSALQYGSWQDKMDALKKQISAK